MNQLEKEQKKGIDTDTVDQQLQRWHKTIIEAATETTPIKISYKLLREVTNPLIRQVQYQYRNLKAQININGWNRNKYILLQLLKRIIISESNKKKLDRCYKQDEEKLQPTKNLGKKWKYNQHKRRSCGR